MLARPRNRLNYPKNPRWVRVDSPEQKTLLDLGYIVEYKHGNDAYMLYDGYRRRERGLKPRIRSKQQEDKLP